MKLFDSILQLLGAKRLHGHTMLLKILPKSPAILDCGAHKGDFQAALQENSIIASKIVCVEANPKLAANLTTLLPNTTTVLTAALTNDTNEKFVTFTISINPEASSIHPEIADSFGAVSQITVPCVTLSELCEQFKPRKVDFLKCDIEGAEVDILLNISEGNLAPIQQMSIEFHDNFRPSTSPDVKRVRNRLRRLGFLEINANWPYTDDILFVRRSHMSPFQPSIAITIAALKSLYMLRGSFFLLLRSLGLKR